MRYNKTILLLHSNPKEAFTDLVKFCRVKGVKGVNYNTYKQRKMPTEWRGMKLEKIPKGKAYEYIKINNELIQVQ